MPFKPFRSFLYEGGNLKVKGAGGEIVSASPFKVTGKVRETLQKDVPEALHQLHHSFHQATGEHLFGVHGKAINNKTAYVGSTRQFMDSSIGHEEFQRHKKEVGDFDILVPSEHKDALYDHAKEGSKFGKFTVVGKKRHGTEATLLMRHNETGHIHQMDFIASKYENDEPTEAERFVKSADWGDIKQGIKGAHHKILLNAAGLDRHKFSIFNGVSSRTDPSEKSSKDPSVVAHKLFGKKADVSKIHSFQGVAELIKNHIPKERHQEVYDKFKSSVAPHKEIDHTAALEHLRTTLGVKDTVSESTQTEKEHHVHVTYMGASPITHQGHYEDIGGSMVRSKKGKMLVGLSGKSKLYTDKQREKIGERQWGGKAKFRVSSSAGETVAHAFHGMPETGRRVLHLHFGHDRRQFAENLKRSLEEGKIKEMDGEKFDRIQIHYPTDENRSHGFSGTAMRTAAYNGDIEEFHRHLGANFTRAEAKEHMDKFRRGFASGEIVIKRK